MYKQEIIDLVITMKSGAVKLQLWDAASALRSIENTFKGQFGEISQNPTIENLSMLLQRYIDTNIYISTSDEDSKSYLKSSLRDLKISEVLK
jgi:hypothetical protein